MSSTVTLTIKSRAHSGATVKDILFPTGTGLASNHLAHNLAKLLQAASGGSHDARVTVSIGEGNTTKASATITCDQSSVAEPDEVVIGDVTLTCVAADPGTDEFLAGDNDAELATNLAAAINAQASLSQVLTAVAESGEVTLVSMYDGVVGNLIKLETDNSSAFTLSSTSLGGATSTSVQAPVTANLGLA